MNRVFTPNEQVQIFHKSFADSDTILWMLWAGKETAYKIICKDDLSVSSIPRQYEVKFCHCMKCKEAVGFSGGGYHVAGFVDTPRNKVHIRIFINHDYIHCIGTSHAAEYLNSVVCHVENLPPVKSSTPDYESEFVRTALKKHLACYCNTNSEKIEIRREKTLRGLGPPLIYMSGIQTDVDISLSHDGRFVAYAFILNHAN